MAALAVPVEMAAMEMRERAATAVGLLGQEAMEVRVAI
jgi:hypothetical protein